MPPLALILDGTAIAYRSYHALEALTAPDGTPTNALYGFIRLFRHLAAAWKPDRIAVAFDGGSPPSRLALCPAYKAQRPPMPPELRAQFPLIEEYLDASRIPRFRLPQQEADDVMATLAHRALASGAVVRIATSDKDLLQLVGPDLWVVPPTRTGPVLDTPGVLAKTGVRPDQIVDWLALVGDTADNLPGISGIGPKTAAKLLAEHGTLAACYQNLDAVTPPRIREKLAASRATAETNVRMMTLDRDVPGLPAWTEIPPPGPADATRLETFLAAYALDSLAPDAPPPASAPSDPDRIAEEEAALADLHPSAPATPPPPAPKPLTRRQRDAQADRTQLHLF